MRICDEMRGAELGDKRLSNRAVEIVRQMASAPAKSFPKATGDDSSLEATYRFLNNAAVEPEAILAPHYRATAERCAQSDTVIIAHDTTELRFSGQRTDLGWLTTVDYGFLGHFALAMDINRVPLGIAGMRTLFREHDRVPHNGGKRPPREERESRRWMELVSEVEERFAGVGKAIHVMDREADFYELLVPMLATNCRFVIRAQFDRATELGTIREEAEAAPVRLKRTVEISARPRAQQPKKARQHPPRKARVANLKASATSVTILRATMVSRKLPASLKINVVRVFEVDTPDGCEPVEWLLLTTEKIKTARDISVVIDAYCARWVIEEYFKALKTGCGFEKRQLENRHALLNALALFTPIAWRLLLLRSLARERTDTPAADALTPLQLRILQRHERTQLRADATVLEAMLAVAALGGHIKNNGPPGWQVLGRGLEDLLLMERGAALVKM
jgi:hypothetical protein